jgi:hypothetical protein
MEKFKQLQDDGFVVREREMGGEMCYLVFPSSLGVKWTKDNLIYRSSIWTAGMRPVSLGFKKFFNYGEAPEVVRDPRSSDILLGGSVVEKIDGSCLIVSRFKGQLICRTRGTFDAREKPTGNELDYLEKKYPKAFQNDDLAGEQCSYIYEWTTRANRIVVDYGEEPDIRLIGRISHDEYRYSYQTVLDGIAQDIGVGRPDRLLASGVSMIKTQLEKMRLNEGYCLYYNNDQDIKKMKCDWYLKAHRFRSNCSLPYVLDLFLSQDCPSITAFIEALQKEYDFECAIEVKSYAASVCKAYANAQVSLLRVEEFTRKLDGKNNRKAAAEAILKEYADTGLTGIAFNRLDGKQTTPHQLKQLILQHL